MKISIAQAETQLADLVRRAEAGEEILLTHRGEDIARLVPIAPTLTPTTRRAVMDAARAAARSKLTGGPTPAARNQDWLYDAAGLPG